MGEAVREFLLNFAAGVAALATIAAVVAVIMGIICLLGRFPVPTFIALGVVIGVPLITAFGYGMRHGPPPGSD